MTRVIASMAMSLDGFIADEDDGCEELFGFYDGGDVPVENPSAGFTMHMSATAAGLYEQAMARTGAFLVGRRLYDLTDGWRGHPPTEAPMVVLTHQPPAHHPTGGVSYTFRADVAEAVEAARELAGDLDVSVGGGAVARAVLDAGLLDEIHVELVPVVLGRGRPWLGGARGPVRLSDPEVDIDAGVTHLRYRVLRDDAPR